MTTTNLVNAIIALNLCAPKHQSGTVDIDLESDGTTITLQIKNGLIVEATLSGKCIPQLVGLKLRPSNGHNTIGRQYLPNLGWVFMSIFSSTQGKYARRRTSKFFHKYGVPYPKAWEMASSIDATSWYKVTTTLLSWLQDHDMIVTEFHQLRNYHDGGDLFMIDRYYLLDNLVLDLSQYI